ncbi:MAG: hypothetical protein ACOY5Y_15770 [Pseudomonadota bacterium]
MSRDLPDRAAEMLAEAAELDLALARKIHGAAMAAEDRAELADLTRSYQRAMRSMRQSLALQIKLTEMRARADQARAEAELARRRAVREGADLPPQGQPGRQSPSQPDFRAVRRRAAELQDAVGRVILRFTEREEEREALFEFLGDWTVETLPATPDFEAGSLDDQVADFCDQMQIPAALYLRWRDLPPLGFEPGSDATPEAAPPAAPAGADTG